jgi:HlyD family secretion protein
MALVSRILGAAFLMAAAFPLAGCSDGQLDQFPGYMEADLVLVGSEQGGRVETLSVEEGDHVTKGAPIFTLESKAEEAGVAAARSRLSEAEARLADAKAELQRPGEIDVLEAALNQAEALLKQSVTNLERTQQLYDKGWVAKAQLDDAVAQHDSNEAAVAQAEKRISAAKLVSRSDVIDAAEASVQEARHSLDEAQKNLAKRKVASQDDGTIEEVYFRPGEVVNAGQAVVALLPPRNLKVRFFVPEPARATLQLGQIVHVTCDGCAPGLEAKISFIARDAEFTPPVIFSQERREKLVFLIEARPEGDAAKLTAGQPVTVTLEPGDRIARQ